MKRNSDGLWIMMVVLFVVGAGFSRPLFSQYNAALLYNFQEDELVARLNLDTEQVDSLQRLGRMLQSQAKSDHLNFKDNVPGLIAAAERRLSMAENLLSTVLIDTQKKLLPEIKEEQKHYRDFFLLNEVLVLDTVQAAKIQTIIETYKPEPMNEENILAEYGEAPSMDQNEMGDRDVPGQPNGRMDRTDRNKRNAAEIYVEILREKEKKKQKAIEALLTPEQKIPYAQLKDILRKEFEFRIEKQKEKAAKEGKDKPRRMD